MNTRKFFLMVAMFACTGTIAICQQKDTLIAMGDSVKLKLNSADSVNRRDTARKNVPLVKPKGNPGKAALYSAIFPGLGQAYNKKYWKVPIVWAAVGIPTYTFFDNKTWYNKTRYALAVLVNGSYTNADSLKKVDSKLLPFIINPNGTVNFGNQQELQNYRNYFRQNEDYSILFLLLFYALNIVDATVDAHLKNFNVSSDLSLNIRPAFIEGSNAAALSFVLDIHRPKPKALIATR